MYTKEKETHPAYILKRNSTREKTMILLMIPNEEKEGCHYLAVKRTVYSINKNNIKTSWWFWFLKLSSENKLKSENMFKSHEIYVKVNFFCGVAMPS